jgi:hypothetical protein
MCSVQDHDESYVCQVQLNRISLCSTTSDTSDKKGISIVHLSTARGLRDYSAYMLKLPYA